jgi:hypothetical protein
MQNSKTNSDRAGFEVDRRNEALSWLLSCLCWEASLAKLRARREHRGATGKGGTSREMRSRTEARYAAALDRLGTE